MDLALAAWSRRKWIALLVFAAVAGAAHSIAKSLPNLYRATATVLVERQQVSEAFVRPSVTTELEMRLQTIRERVMSRTQLAELITRFDLYGDARRKTPMDALVAKMRRDVQFELKGVESQTSGRMSTIAFTITYTGRDPSTVAKITNELAARYVVQNASLREGQASRTAEFLKAQLADVRRQLDETERHANEYRLQHIGELPQQVGTNLASLERVNTQLRLNGENQIRAIERRERLERQRDEAAAPPPTPPPSPDAERLARLRQQLDDLRMRFTDAYPDVIRVQGEIDALAPQVAQHSAPARPADSGTRVSAALAAADAELRSLKDEERILRQAIAGFENRVENAPKRQQEFQELSRDYETTKERYETLLKRYEEARLADSLEQGQSLEQFRMLDPAIPPRDPVAPNRVQLLAMGIMAALALAVAAVFAAEKLDTVFHTLDDVRAFARVATVARVPLIATRADLRRRRRRAVLLAVTAAAGLVLVVAGARYVAQGNEQMVRLLERSR